MAQATAFSMASSPLPQLQAFQPYGLLLPVGGKLSSKSFQAPLQRVNPGENTLLSLVGPEGKNGGMGPGEHCSAWWGQREETEAWEHTTRLPKYGHCNTWQREKKSQGLLTAQLGHGS